MDMDKRKLQILMDLVEEERGRDINQRWDDELYSLSQYLLQQWHLNRFNGALMGDYKIYGQDGKIMATVTAGHTFYK